MRTHLPRTECYLGTDETFVQPLGGTASRSPPAIRFQDTDDDHVPYPSVHAVQGRPPTVLRGKIMH